MMLDDASTRGYKLRGAPAWTETPILAMLIGNFDHESLEVIHAGIRDSALPLGTRCDFAPSFRDDVTTD